ncbi:hypothetical protein [Cryptosporangium sp. NPDC051539]|uniref:hypothetical protein n=1 Tax=Cryptosporangium sp. NPDC051539 TaxID=3363962 RepID=UPI00378C7FBD
MPRVLRCLVFGLISLLALGASVRLLAPADTTSSVRRQLTFLRAELESGAAERAQDQFPEGYFFLYALYGLAQVDLGLAGDEPDRSRREAGWALRHLESAAGRRPFDAGLTPAYGIFYRGWVNWLRGGILRLPPHDAADAAEVARFERDSAEIAAAFDASATPYLAAYPGQAWPVDSTVAAASLALHDAVLSRKYQGTVARWTAKVRAGLDPATGLIPHTADVTTGAPTSSARGSSQSIIQRFLPEIDPPFARSQYTRFRTTFLSRPLGLGPAIREYPHGTDGAADVDSGPLPLGVSFAATVVTIGAAKVQGDESLADGLARFGEVAGLPIDTWHTRRYAFGLLPIGDAFLAWSKSARPWVAATPPPPKRAVPGWWPLPLLVVFVAIGAAPWLIRLRRRS